METNHFKAELFEDLRALQNKTIPTLSAKELYGSLLKHLIALWVAIITASVLGDMLLMKVGFKHMAESKDDLVMVGIVFGGGWSIFLSFALTGGFQKLIVFKKTIKPLMKTGEAVHQKIRFICYVYSGIYLSVLTIFSFFIGTFGFGHFPAIIGTLFIGNAFLQGEITRLGIPELPKIIERISEGRPISFN